MGTKVAVVIGASGGIGAALVAALEDSARFDKVLGLSRSSTPSLDLLDEASIERAARWAEAQAGEDGEIGLVFDATGALTIDGQKPEKSLREIDGVALARSYSINAIGPVLLMKHFLPLLPREGRGVFATLSARVGSIGDNHLGGWYGYRAAKAGLNQLVRTAAVELARKKREAICVSLHPGTVQTPLTEGFAKRGLEVQSPEQAAQRLIRVIENLTPSDTGGFFDHLGQPVVW
ncbi:SDR family NAD(P)-dependent oxidoreductase [Roseibium sp.]|uniref:SDR family NAD(P)-dependent oxidoreductase n=1 Tax=Roseibium sp. TaxID=1936156 RepID=UPI003A97827F